jgi:formylglycine-generating enzyme required for sulfatase activity
LDIEIMNDRPKKTRSPQPLKIEIGERIEGQDPRPPGRWKPWAWTALAVLLLAGAGAATWLALSRDTRPLPPDTVADAAPPTADEPAVPAEPPAEPDLADLIAPDSGLHPSAFIPHPSLGSLRILVRAPDHAEAYLAKTAKRLRLATNAWELVADFPHLVADLPPGPIEVTLDITGFIVGAASRRVPLPDTAAQPTATALIESDRTNELVFALSPAPARLVIACNAPEAGIAVDPTPDPRHPTPGTAFAVAALQQLTVAVSAPGHRPQKLTLGPFDPLSRHRHAVTLERQAGALRVAATVEGVAAEAATPYLEKARIRLDDGEWKAAPLPHTIEQLPCREHAVFLKVEGFKVDAPPAGEAGRSRRVTVRDAETVEAAFVLRPKPARLTVVCAAPNAEVFDADGQRLGAAGEALSLASLQSLALTVRAPGHVAGSVRLRAMEPGKAYRHEVTLEKLGDHDLASARENSLGMKFAPVAGLDGVLFGIWETRVRDFRAFVEDRANNNGYDYRAGVQAMVLKSDGWKQRGWDYGWDNPGFAQTEDHPVTCVSWEDAQAFCAWLTRVDRAAGRIGPTQAYRLPRDWEWSVAVGLNEPHTGTPREKSGRIDQYPWGTNRMPPPARWGNYAGDEAKNADWPSFYNTIANYRDDHARTSPVGYYGAKHGALCDLGGNVSEWCEDFYDVQNQERVLRGGSWLLTYSPNRLLSSHRSYFYRSEPRFGYIGFRVVLAGALAPSAGIVENADDGHATHASVALSDTDQLLLDRLGLTLTVTADGLKIADIEPNSPAALSRLAANDHVLSLNQQSVRTPEDFVAIARNVQGNVMRLLVQRSDGRTVTVAVRTND